LSTSRKVVALSRGAKRGKRTESTSCKKLVVKFNHVIPLKGMRGRSKLAGCTRIRNSGEKGRKEKKV